MMTKDKWHGHLAILASNFIFGLNSPIAKTIVPEWISPYALTLVRMFFAALLFWTVSFFVPKEHVKIRDLVIIFWGALFGLIGSQLSFANALLYTSPVNITIIAAMTPVVVMLLAAFVLKEPITIKKVAGVLIGISGALLIIMQSTAMGSGKEGSLIGNLFCIANTVTYAIYLVITRSISQRYSPVTLMKWMFLFAALISLPLGIGDLSTSKIFTNETSLNLLLRLSYIVIMATGIAYFLVPMALKRIRPTTVSMYNNVQPIVASVIAIILGQDVMSWDKPVAVCLVFVGVYLVTQSKSREELEKAGKRKG